MDSPDTAGTHLSHPQTKKKQLWRHISQLVCIHHPSGMLLTCPSSSAPPGKQPLIFQLQPKRDLFSLPARILGFYRSDYCRNGRNSHQEQTGLSLPCSSCELVLQKRVRGVKWAPLKGAEHGQLGELCCHRAAEYSCLGLLWLNVGISEQRSLSSPLTKEDAKGYRDCK